MVAAVVVVVTPAVACAVAGVPDVRKVRHRAGFPAVDLLQKPWVYRAAVAAHAAPVQLQSFCDQAFVACHDVGEVPKALRRVPWAPMWMCTPHPLEASLLAPACLSCLQSSLQGFDVPVG